MNKPFQRLGKRAIDLAGGSLGLIVSSPVLAATAIAIRTTMGTPVLFRQVRPGINGAPFTLIKFRTMRNEVGSDGKLLSDAERLTRLGIFLRKASIDELPQLWNVVRGDISLVGPRPLLMQYLSRYSTDQARRNEVQPGITGWAQVNGRNAISWEKKFELDVWYVDNWSLWLDVKILGLTALKVLKCSGISEQGHVTMREFTGEPNSK